MNLGQYIAHCLLQESTSPYTVYFDMDDTLVDYSGQLEKTQLTPKDTVKPENISFWENMEWLPGSKEMLKTSLDHFNTKILTRTPEFELVKQAKKDWVKNNIGDIEVITVRRGSNKAEYASPTSILIDDKRETIDKFRQAGGIGILFNNNPAQIIQILTQYINPTNLKEDKIPGGLAQGKTLEDIAKKHKIKYVSTIFYELKKGIKVELEHTTDPKIAKEIAMDHLWEDPKYYDKLEKIEKSNLQESKFTSDFKKYISYINKLVDYVCEDLQIERPKIKIINDIRYTQENHSFGGYSPGDKGISLVIKGRNCSDSCRSLSHELFHRYQDQNNILKPGDGKDGDDIENAANSYAGKIMREFNRKYPEILTLIN